MKTGSNTIDVHYREKPDAAVNPGKIAESILDREKKEGCKINIVFTGNDFIQKVNIKYRMRNYATDVIAFGFSKKDYGDEGGDVFISVDKAAENAGKYGVSLKEEIIRLIIHGVLHVIGYDHEKGGAGKKNMTRKQEGYLRRAMKGGW